MTTDTVDVGSELLRLADELRETAEHVDRQHDRLLGRIVRLAAISIEEVYSHLEEEQR